MTRSEVIHHLYAVFNTHPLYDINLVKLNHILDEVEAHEREACAWLCEDLERHKWETLKNGGPLKGFSAMDCAAAIRARGQA
jgi:hypothetical protein